MAPTISTILRARIFGAVSMVQLTWSVPAPGWQSAQSRPRSAEITPMLVMKSATGSTLREGVVTFLKYSPALGPVFGAAAGACATALPVKMEPIMHAPATAAAATRLTFDLFNLLFILSPEN